MTEPRGHPPRDTRLPDETDPREAETRRVEALLFHVLSQEPGRALMAWILGGDHGLGHCFSPGMDLGETAWHSGRQYSAREIARVARTTERTSGLFDLAIREETRRTES